MVPIWFTSPEEPRRCLLVILAFHVGIGVVRLRRISSVGLQGFHFISSVDSAFIQAQAQIVIRHPLLISRLCYVTATERDVPPTLLLQSVTCHPNRQRHPFMVLKLAEILDVCMDTVHAMLYEPSLGAACNLGRLYVAIKRLETVQYYHTLYLDWWQRRDWQDNQDRQLMQELRMDSDYDDSSENSPRWGFEIDSDGNWHDIPPSSPSMSW